jgi:TetR/AcrR family transcriptional regulator
MDPETGVRQLVHLLMSIWVEHQEYGKLLASENFHGGKHVRRSKLIGEIYQQLVEALTDLLKRGASQGVFRENIDPIDLYISISSLSAYYVAHQHTLNAIFHIDVMQPRRLQQREEHIIDMILRFVRLNPDN